MPEISGFEAVSTINRIHLISTSVKEHFAATIEQL
jgi:hypothetical protein